MIRGWSGGKKAFEICPNASCKQAEKKQAADREQLQAPAKPQEKTAVLEEAPKTHVEKHAKPPAKPKSAARKPAKAKTMKGAKK